jgi:hypothetical protein
MPRAQAAASPTRTAEQLVRQLLTQFRPRLARGYWGGKKVTDVPAGKALLAADRDIQAAAVAAVMDRLDEWDRDYAAYRRKLKPHEVNGSRPEWQPLYNRKCLLVDTLRGLLRRKLLLPEDLLIRFLRRPLAEPGYFSCYGFAILSLTRAVEHHAAIYPLGPTLRNTVAKLARRLRASTYDRDAPPIVRRLDALLDAD